MYIQYVLDGPALNSLNIEPNNYSQQCLSLTKNLTCSNKHLTAVKSNKECALKCLTDLSWKPKRLQMFLQKPHSTIIISAMALLITNVFTLLHTV